MQGSVTQQEKIERARPQAAGALEDRKHPAWAAHPGTFERDEQVIALVKLAQKDYRLRYPACRPKTSWLFYDGNPKTTLIRGTPERVDVYCLFCRVLLVAPAIWEHDYDYDPRVRPHTTRCALRSLAGLLIPGAPGTYRLPAFLDGADEDG
jgi:hypothetical protein